MEAEEEKIKLLVLQRLMSYNVWLFVCFIAVLIIIRIGYSHSADRKVNQITQLNEEVNSLKSQFVDIRSKLQKERLESSLLERLETRGLKQHAKPPQRLKVSVEE